MINLATQLNFHSPEWTVMKAYLLEQKEVKVRQLIGSKDHDESNVLRGDIKRIELLLQAEKEAAALAATRG